MGVITKLDHIAKMSGPESDAELDKLFNQKVDAALKQTKGLRKNMHINIAISSMTLGLMLYANYAFKPYTFSSNTYSNAQIDENN